MSSPGLGGVMYCSPSGKYVVLSHCGFYLHFHVYFFMCLFHFVKSLFMSFVHFPLRLFGYFAAEF